MTSLWCFEFLLCLLPLHQAHGEEPEPVFRAQGGTMEMGYCFGVDYIVVYRCASGGDQLLGNSSANTTAVIPPADLQGRIHINHHHQLLGLKVRNLTHEDSGIYRRECWKNQKLASQLTQQLFVCNEEFESKEIVVNEGAAEVELLCNHTFSGLPGTSVRWYHEMYPTYTVKLFLDSSVLLEPLAEEMKGVTDVRDKGALLVINKSVMKSSQHFHCLVNKGKRCLSFQNMHLPDGTESRDVFVSHGDRVVLKCPSDGNHQQWDTPVGKINASSTRNPNMYIAAGDRSEDFSLVIPAVSEEYSGDYSCISTSLELQYILMLCPKNKPEEKMFFEGGDFSLQCKVNHDSSQRVMWYRTETSAENQLIWKDNSTLSLEDLRGRVTVSDNGTSLMISNMKTGDAGVYWCVAAQVVPEFLEHDDDFKYDYEGEELEDGEEYDDHVFWHNRCIFKQETVVTLFKPAIFSPGRNLDAISTADPPPAPDVTAIVVGAGVVALVMVGLIAAAIVIRKKMGSSRSGVHTSNNIGMDDDPACTGALTSDECDA